MRKRHRCHRNLSIYRGPIRVRVRVRIRVRVTSRHRFRDRREWTQISVEGLEIGRVGVLGYGLPILEVLIQCVLQSKVVQCHDQCHVGARIWSVSCRIPNIRVR